MLRLAYRFGLASLIPLGLVAGCSDVDASDESASDLTEVTSLFADARKLHVDDLTRASRSRPTAFRT
jgi:hypothetical protein